MYRYAKWAMAVIIKALGRYGTRRDLDVVHSRDRGVQMGRLRRRD